MVWNTYWQIDNTEKAKLHKITAKKEAIDKEKLLGLFEFEVRRYKDKSSRKEQLEISAKVSGEYYGKIKSDLIRLEKEIERFKSYGVVLGGNKYRELCKFITENYYYFEPEEISIDNEVTDEVADEVLEILFNYIYDNQIEAKEFKERTGRKLQLYNIPLTEFNNELKDGKFRNYNFTEIKEKLREKEYTHSNKGKFDYVVSENGQKTKMISIHKDIVERILQEEVYKEEEKN